MTPHKPKPNRYAYCPACKTPEQKPVPGCKVCRGKGFCAERTLRRYIAQHEPEIKK